MKRLLIIILPVIVVLIIIAFASTTQAPTQFCINETLGWTTEPPTCADSAADYFYERTGNRITFSPEDIDYDIAVQTYDAFQLTHGTQIPTNLHVPTALPDGSTIDPLALTQVVEQFFSGEHPNNLEVTPIPTYLTPQPGNGEFCTNMPDGSSECFDSVGAFIYEMSEGRLTIVPDDLPFPVAIATYNAFIMANNTPRLYEPTPLPDGSILNDPVLPPFLANQVTATPTPAD